LDKVVTPTLERQKAGGAVAEKFELAYLRSFDFSDPPRREVENIYAKWVGHGEPEAAGYKLLQDFLFHYIATECGRLGMPVHLHAMAGAGYFSVGGVNPLLLEPLFNDPRLRKTSFVLLHGGWPYIREIGSLLQKPNVYLDISSQDLIIPPHTEAQWLREWLELEPEKVLFGTDGYSYSDGLGWAESTWIANRNARQALGIALTGMLRDGEIDRKRAGDLARMVLRGNAEALYKF
jgi:predicted TIM-barrel fold metal-dependent hydrolase